MTKLNFIAEPGIAIVKELKDKTTSSIITSEKSPGRIVKGEIIAIGEYDTTSTGEKVMPERFGKVGDIVWFLHYAIEGGADIGTIDGVKYVFVKWADLRARLK